MMAQKKKEKNEINNKLTTTRKNRPNFKDLQ